MKSLYSELIDSEEVNEVDTKETIITDNNNLKNEKDVIGENGIGVNVNYLKNKNVKKIATINNIINSNGIKNIFGKNKKYEKYENNIKYINQQKYLESLSRNDNNTFKIIKHVPIFKLNGKNSKILNSNQIENNLDFFVSSFNSDIEKEQLETLSFDLNNSTTLYNS
jgi:hypothetical protein